MVRQEARDRRLVTRPMSHVSCPNPVIGPPPCFALPREIAQRFPGLSPGNASHFTGRSKALGVGRMVQQEHAGGRDVAPIGAGLRVPRALPVGLHCDD